MKRILLTPLLFAATFVDSSMAQGTLVFANSPSSLVQIDMVPHPLHPATAAEDAHVELYWAPLGTTDINLFQAVPGLIGAVGIVSPGRFSGGVRTIPAGSGYSGIAPGAEVSCYIRAWYGGPTWFTAFWGSYSAIFTVDTGDPTTTPDGTPGYIYNSTATPFTGVIIAIPEPSSAMLLIVGSGLLCWNRRRVAG